MPEQQINLLPSTHNMSASPAGSRRLLQNFYARVAKKAGQPIKTPIQAPVASTSSSASPTVRLTRKERYLAAVDERIPSMTFAASTNPFVRQKQEQLSRTGRPIWHSPLYSLRYQQKLARASNLVDEPSWPLPSSPKFNEERAKKSLREQTIEDYLDQYAKTDVRGTDIAFKEGPYKGRQSKPIKLHKWEREADARKQRRKEKIDAMPARIADYMKVRFCSSKKCLVKKADLAMGRSLERRRKQRQSLRCPSNPRKHCPNVTIRSVMSARQRWTAVGLNHLARLLDFILIVVLGAAGHLSDLRTARSFKCCTTTLYAASSMQRAGIEIADQSSSSSRRCLSAAADSPKGLLCCRNHSSSSQTVNRAAT